MTWRNLIYILVVILVDSFCWFFAIIFCGVYPQTTPGWVSGIWFGAMIDWCIISIVIPLMKSLIRITVRTCPKLFFLIYIEYLFWIKEFCG